MQSESFISLFCISWHNRHQNLRVDILCISMKVDVHVTMWKLVKSRVMRELSSTQRSKYLKGIIR